jgi:hypothetical protein
MRYLSAIATLLLLVGTATAGATDRRTIAEKLSVDPGQRVRIEIPVAELEIVATDGQEVTVELRVRCRWEISECSEVIKRLELESRSSARRRTIELIGHSSWKSSILQVEGVIEVPRSSPLA